MFGIARAPILLLLLVLAYASARPLQYIPEIPGYIPVYIRYGDQPLEEINPALAEAFRETSLPQNIDIRFKEESEDSRDLSNKNAVSMDSKEGISEETDPVTNEFDESHIIPESNQSGKDSVVMKLDDKAKVSKLSQKEKLEIERIAKELKQKERST